MAAPAGAAPAAGDAAQPQEQPVGQSMLRMGFQVMMISCIMNMFTSRFGAKPPAQRPQNVTNNTGEVTGHPDQNVMVPNAFRNVLRENEEFDLYIHLSSRSNLTLDQVLSQRASTSEEQAGLVAPWTGGTELLWKLEGLHYTAEQPIQSINVSIPPLPDDVLSGEETVYIIATMFPYYMRGKEEDDKRHFNIINMSLPLTRMFRPFSTDEDNVGLLGGDEPPAPVAKNKTERRPYFKTKVEVRPVYDMTVHTRQTIHQGPFGKLKLFPKMGIYQPYLYLSDFWNLEKDYLPLNETLSGQPLNLTITYSVVTAWIWGLQTQMNDQWTTQGEWGMTDTQRDSFMLKRLYIDTNPYLLAFSGIFILLHTVFSMLAFKNDIQFWRRNESMQGLSARSMVVSWFCQVITSLYLLDSQEASRLILFEICLDTVLSTWKLTKAVKVEVKPQFPFVGFGSQKGYDAESATAKYDNIAIQYMTCCLGPLMIGYTVRSLLYGKHRSWWSFIVGSAAGGVYCFGFIMMTPQLYINYKLKSVEALPWRALTYKAMNTFVDDIAALLIDMPIMHRLSCFRDDIIFFVYLYQRWAYRTDHSRPSIWVEQEGQTEIQNGGTGEPQVEPKAVGDKAGVAEVEGASQEKDVNSVETSQTNAAKEENKGGSGDSRALA